MLSFGISEELLYRVMRGSSECREAASIGLVCSHLICACRELPGGAFPEFLVYHLWFIEGWAREISRIDLRWQLVAG
jgi:hypothetical protein